MPVVPIPLKSPPLLPRQCVQGLPSPKSEPLFCWFPAARRVHRRTDSLRWLARERLSSVPSGLPAFLRRRKRKRPRARAAERTRWPRPEGQHEGDDGRKMRREGSIVSSSLSLPLRCECSHLPSDAGERTQERGARPSHARPTWPICTPHARGHCVSKGQLAAVRGLQGAL